jgi:23S rRNA pseudouridine1911/1915/1917 synthase
MNILFEDYYILAVEKPAGLSSESGSGSHPSAEREALFYLTEQLRQNSSSNRLKATPYLRVAHRLDRPVGGILILAKTKMALTGLMEQFERGEIQKTYLAKTVKVPEPETATLSNYIMKDPTGRKALVFDAPKKGLQACSLTYKVLNVQGKEAFVEIQPNEGKFHQIRAQLAHIGCPIVGDHTYGGPVWREHQIKLYAIRLAFKHPKSGEEMVLELEKPSDW